MKIISKETRENETVRYSRQPLKQRSNPEIYESLQDLIDEPPPPPSIETLPRNKTVPFKKQLSLPDGACNDRKITCPTERPRYPLPHETERTEVPPLLPKRSNFATMPTRTPKLRRMQPPMSM
ncbi:unnamed protein product [Danaus chrysippus]|uniref:(African queen) hypothetical protein n=1 Tax=Danaus chrysippus TaxID=151541 RepID=A0A8J2W2Y6_9NEOP|nr:unnamed protein product [Danaus chrysippus]